MLELILRHLCLALALLVIGLVPCNADGVPRQLRGKTISASWTESSLIQADGEDKPAAASRTTTQTIYLSSEGRIFVRSEIVTSGQQKAKFEQNPQKTPSHFQNGAIVARVGQVNGAAQKTIRFSPDFQLCTVSVIDGRPQSGSRRYRSEVDGRTYTVLGATTVSNERCSIAAGNGLQQ
jgi:hypothetical protein